MSDKVQNKATLYDLTDSTPPHITMQGVGQPHSDGNNKYREIKDTRGFSLSIDTKSKDAFLQLEYQLYSPLQNIIAKTYLDGQFIGKANFQKGQFNQNYKGGYFREKGKHTFIVELECNPSPCKSIRQYWTKITEVPSLLPARQQIGFGIDSLTPFSSNTELQINTSYPLQYDGNNIFYGLLSSKEKMPLQIKWQQIKRANQLSFSLYGNKDSTTRVTINNKEIYSKVLKKEEWDSVHINLVPYPSIHSIQIESHCVKDKNTQQEADSLCSSLFFPKLSVFSPQLWWTSSIGGIAVVISGIILLCFILMKSKKSQASPSY